MLSARKPSSSITNIFKCRSIISSSIFTRGHIFLSYIWKIRIRIGNKVTTSSSKQKQGAINAMPVSHQTSEQCFHLHRSNPIHYNTRAGAEQKAVSHQISWSGGAAHPPNPLIDLLPHHWRANIICVLLNISSLCDPIREKAGRRCLIVCWCFDASYFYPLLIDKT